MIAPQQPEERPKRRKGADHFGYGYQISLGKGKEGESLWHSHGKHYHKPDTFWCGSCGDRTPDELISECESTLEDLRLYFPELFRSRPHPAPVNKCLCPQCTFDECLKRCKEHDTAIRADAPRQAREDERRKVLDEIAEVF